MGVKIMDKIELKKGLEYTHLQEYNDFFMNFDKEKVKNSDRDGQKNAIRVLTNMLDQLYGLIEKVRDEHLVEEYGVTYKELFEKSVNVNMPVDVQIFYLQKQYYNLIMELYEFMGIK